MIRFYALEKWKEFKVHNSLKLRYAVSNYGRLISFTDKVENGRLLKGSKVDGYPVFAHKIRVKGKTKDKKIFIHKLVAEHFLKRKSEEYVFVLHIDRYRNNNSVDNLKWATRQEMLEHNRTSPFVLAARKKLIRHNKNRDGLKMTSSKVILLKKKLMDPDRKTRLRILAKQFGISEMQLYRIKSGENWGHIKV
jgi:hypothetical protein